MGKKALLSHNKFNLEKKSQFVRQKPAQYGIKPLNLRALQ